MTGSVSRLQLALLLASTALAATPAFAQDAADASEGASTTQLSEDIIVTARKRNETLLDVPVAVSAVSAADLNRYAATDLSKIGQLVPQVIIAKTGGGGAGASFAIRGVGSSALDAGIDQTVALNIDGLQISRGRLVGQSFFDVAQVEVLKGPQALFFGKNSPGGVISLRTEGPTRELSGYARAGYEFNARERFVEGAIAGPISDTLGFRVAARGSKMSGFIKNTAQPLDIPSDPGFPTGGAGHSRDPGTREILGRATLEWAPVDSFTATLKVFGASMKDHGETSGTEVKCSGNPQTLDLLSGTFVQDPYGDCTLNGKRSHGSLNADRAKQYTGARDGNPYTKYSSLLTSLSMNWNVTDDVAITSVTGYWEYNNKSFDLFSFDGSSGVTGFNQDKSSDFTQELRVASSFDGPLNFTIGGFYENGSRTTLGHGGIAAVGPDSRTGKIHNWTLDTDNNNEAVSAFAQMMWKIVPKLELAGGVRYTHETKDVLMGNSFVNDNFAPLGITQDEGVFTSGKFKDSDWSPEATLSYHPDSNSTLYVAYKTGYKSGGFSNPAILSAGQGADNLGFSSESASGFELGAKGKLLDNRLTVTAAIYTYKFNGLQLTSFNPSPPSFTIRNAASARTKGAEFELAYRATDELRLRFAGGYNRARYLSFEAAPCYAGQTLDQGCTAENTQDLSGTALVRAPKVNLTGGATYDIPAGSGFNVGFSSDANYTSGYWLQENQNPVAWQKGFVRLNASVRLYEPQDRWELALIGRNLTNKYYGIASADKPFGTPDQIWVNIGRPREVLLQGTVRF